MITLADHRQKKTYSNGTYKIVDGIKYKKCSICGQWLTLDNFTKANETSYQGYCKACKFEYNTKRLEQKQAPKKQTKSPIKKVCQHCGINKSIDDFPQQRGEDADEFGRYKYCYSCCAMSNRAAGYTGSSYWRK